MKTPTENRSAFLAAVLARALPDASPAAIARAVTAMQTAARAAKRWSATECSYPLTDAQQARGEKRCARLATAAYSALFVASGLTDATDDAAWSLTVNGRTLALRFGGDPRSPCGFLRISNMPGDGWSKDDGFAIYT